MLSYRQADLRVLVGLTPRTKRSERISVLVLMGESYYQTGVWSNHIHEICSVRFKSRLNASFGDGDRLQIESDRTSLEPVVADHHDPGKVCGAEKNASNKRKPLI